MEGIYGHKAMETEARKMRLWRKPAVHLESPAVLHDSFDEDETWRVWPRTWDLKTFVQKHWSRTVDSIAANYFQVWVVDWVDQCVCKGWWVWGLVGVEGFLSVSELVGLHVQVGVGWCVCVCRCW